MYLHYPDCDRQFRTQDDPAFCGLATLVMTLNALHIDPGRTWKGVWRWFDESKLDCCKPLERLVPGLDEVVLAPFVGLIAISHRNNDRARTEGVTFKEVVCLARCNGAMISQATYADRCTEDEFRTCVRRCSAITSEFLIVSYGRAGLGQTGDGHFSPIGAYHQATDSVLILDVARFKYPPHWVSVSVLYHAMHDLLDAVTHRSRGFMVLTTKDNVCVLLRSMPFAHSLARGSASPTRLLLTPFMPSGTTSWPICAVEPLRLTGMPHMLHVSLSPCHSLL